MEKVSLFFVVVDSFYTGRDGGEEFVGNGTGSCGIALKEISFAENDGAVPFLACDAGDIDKTHIHAYAADDGDLGSGYGDMSGAVAEMPV